MRNNKERSAADSVRRSADSTLLAQYIVRCADLRCRADYRDPLTPAPVLAHSAGAGVAAGVIKPATEPKITPDPKIGFDPATNM